MPRKRPPLELWLIIRRRVLERFGWKCARCGCALTERSAHIDHLQSGFRAGNALVNLRPLCRRDHVLRADHLHQGLISEAIRDGVIPPNWRGLVWEDP